jgi:hypothetical protein
MSDIRTYYVSGNPTVQDSTTENSNEIKDSRVGMKHAMMQRATTGDFSCNVEI